MVTRQGPISRAVTKALKDAPVNPEDGGAVELAKRYAALIDAAQPTSAYAEHLRALAAAIDPDDPTAQKHLTKISDALSAHSVASDLGPKLLAALTALGMTGAGRGAKGGATGGPGIAGKLDEFTARRTRKHAS